MATIGPRSETPRFRSNDPLVGRAMTNVAEHAKEAYRRVSNLGGGQVRFKAEPFFAILVNEGPEGESDYADCRYWARTIRITNPGTDALDAKTTVEDVPSGGANYWYGTATHLVELADDTHNLPVRVGSAGGIIVRVYRRPDAGGKTRYVFNAGGTGAFYVRLKVRAGGDAGGTSSAPTWRYDCYPLNTPDVSAGGLVPTFTDVGVLHNRRSPIRMLAAQDGSIGLVVVDPLDGLPYLYAPPEQLDLTPCGTA